MANATIASQVQALYVGYLGRAADQGGLDFWTNAIAAGTSTIESVALGFVESAEYTALYADKTNEELAAAIYENVLGRAADADGLAFWVGEIENGTVTADTLLASMLNSLGAVDQQVIGNKVFVANAYTAAAGADYSAAAGAKVLEGVNGTAASVSAALATLPTSTATLTDSLKAVETAGDNLHNFYTKLDLNFDGKTDYTEAQSKAAGFDTVADNALTTALNGAASTVGLTTETTAAQIQAKLALVKANLAAELVADQSDLKALNTLLTAFDATAAGKGSSSAVAAFNAATTANEAAIKAAASTEADLQGALAKVQTAAQGVVASTGTFATAGDTLEINVGGTSTEIATYDSVAKTRRLQVLSATRLLK